MPDKNENLARELRKRLMKEFNQQIGELLDSVPAPVEIKSDAPPSGSAPAETPPPTHEEGNNPDKINTIRSEVAATPMVLDLTPDKQSEMMEIIKQRYEEFERELCHIAPGDNSLVEAEAQKFKDELISNARNQLEERKLAVPAHDLY